jgi:hypothetical protein
LRKTYAQEPILWLRIYNCNASAVLDKSVFFQSRRKFSSTRDLYCSN